MNSHDRRRAAAIARKLSSNASILPSPEYFERRRRGVIIACYAMAILCIIALAALPAFAHSWYSTACCSGEDCAPIARDRVTWTKTGWRVELRQGDHPMLTTGDGFVEIVPFDEALPSLDSDFHACVNRPAPGWQQIERVICLYVPLGDVGA
jgi:hypothetical protein